LPHISEVDNLHVPEKPGDNIQHEAHKPRHRQHCLRRRSLPSAGDLGPTDGSTTSPIKPAEPNARTRNQQEQGLNHSPDQKALSRGVDMPEGVSWLSYRMRQSSTSIHNARRCGEELRGSASWWGWLYQRTHYAECLQLASAMNRDPSRVACDPPSRPRRPGPVCIFARTLQPTRSQERGHFDEEQIVFLF